MTNQDFLLKLLFDGYLLGVGEKLQNSIAEELYNTYFLVLSQ
jgi:hypothetical protein